MYNRKVQYSIGGIPVVTAYEFDEQLTETHTGLYYQSPLYVYDFLKNELKMNNLF